MMNEFTVFEPAGAGGMGREGSVDILDSPSYVCSTFHRSPARVGATVLTFRAAGTNRNRRRMVADLGRSLCADLDSGVSDVVA
jgi:hypothetical protein